MLRRILGRIRSWRKLSLKFQELLSEAEKAMENAHCPYSGISVGAAILTASGKIFIGCNLEAPDYGNSKCAEQAALLAANTGGYFEELRAIAVIARGRDSPTKRITTPCGTCRQLLFNAAQVAGYDLRVIMATTHKEKIAIVPISKLLPLAFGAKDLEVGRTVPVSQTQLAEAG